MFLHRFAKQKGKRFRSVSSEAVQILLHHSWPGNIRELQNVVEWSVFMFDDTELRAKHLKITASNEPLRSGTQTNTLIPNAPVSLPSRPFKLDDYVDQIIVAALEMHNGNKSAAASYLGLSRRSLSYRLEKLMQDN